MKYAQKLKKGLSVKSAELEYWKNLKAAGIDCIELSFDYNTYMGTLDFPSKAELYGKNAALAGLEIWSIHLPFSREYDISSTNTEHREKTIRANALLIQAAGRIGIKTAVLHPSSEPIDDASRAERIRRSREAILYLRDVADKAGVVLAVENLPRTCLCNRASEMAELLSGTGAKVVFDTNHSLIQDNLSFIHELFDSGLEIWSLHISDYDFIDERHRLPGLGINDWNGILRALGQANYRGPLLYEIAFSPRDNDPRYAVTLDILSENMKKLAEGAL